MNKINVSIRTLAKFVMVGTLVFHTSTIGFNIIVESLMRIAYVITNPPQPAPNIYMVPPSSPPMLAR